MSCLRPEVEAFVRAGQTLIVMSMLSLPLTQEEEIAIADCLNKLDEQLSKGEQ